MEIKAELDSVYDIIYLDQRKYVADFVKEHPSSLVSLIVLNRKLGNTAVIDEEKDFHLFHQTDSLLSFAYPNNKHVVDHQKRTKEIRLRIFDYYQAERKVIPGKKAPDIVLNDTAGNLHSIKSFMGKKVIVYFWAGWDARSRQDNRKLVKIYDELKLKNTEIIGVSLDENEVVWKGAVKLDKLPWLNVSSLKGFRSEVKKSYNVSDELPFYYLLDEEQRIVGKSLELDKIIRLSSNSSPN
jgi:peroxiredoxin